MKLYERNQYSRGKRCRTRVFHSDDYRIAMAALPEYIPESRIIIPEIEVYTLSLEDRGLETEFKFKSTSRTGNSLVTFKKELMEWFLENKGVPYYLSWYTAKKIMMLTFKMYKRGLK